MEQLQFPTEEMALDELRHLRQDSGTGSDGLPAKILKNCAGAIAKPIALLVMRILCMESWPDGWREHWIMPIFKRGAVFKPENYRGIHLTAQISKVAERMIKKITEPFLEKNFGVGFNQFAYRKERGARDALALLTIKWLRAFNNRENIGLLQRCGWRIRQSATRTPR